MGEPDNDFFQLRADDLRDETAYRHRIQSAARKLANNVELKVANMAAEMGSLVITSPDAIGTNTADAWNFVADAEELMFSRELNRDMGTSYFFNPQDYKKAGYDLTKRDIFGRIRSQGSGQSTLGSAISGGTNGALAGAGLAGMLGASTPWGAGIGAGIGLLGSLF